jgi:hypothetical protein
MFAQKAKTGKASAEFRPSAIFASSEVQGGSGDNFAYLVLKSRSKRGNCDGMVQEVTPLSELRVI